MTTPTNPDNCSHGTLPRDCESHTVSGKDVDADIKLVIFGWITQVLGLPEKLDPTQYNELTDKIYDMHKSLLKSELQAVKSEMPEKSRRVFKDPRRMADTQNAHKAAITEMTEKLDKRLKSYE